MSDITCPSNGWSIIDSASTNSQFAGVLAGFLFSGIVILYTRRGSRNTQTLGLFCAAFLVLAFDSYIFSMMTGLGDSPIVVESGASPGCARAWSVGMVASGMLALGGVGVVTGIGWLLVSNAELHPQANTATQDEAPGVDLARVTGVMAHGVNVGVALLVAKTTADYLNLLHPHVSPWLLGAVFAMPLAVFCAAVALSIIRRMNERNGKKVGFSRTSVAIAVFGTLIYGLTAPVFTGILTSFHDDWWTTADTGTVVIVVSSGLVIPGILLVFLVLAVPPLSHPLPARGEHDSNDREGTEALNPTVKQRSRSTMLERPTKRTKQYRGGMLSRRVIRQGRGRPR